MRPPTVKHRANRIAAGAIRFCFIAQTGLWSKNRRVAVSRAVRQHDAMHYDLELLGEFCRECGLAMRQPDESTLEVFLGDGAILCFRNAEREEDCLVGFSDTPWHAHGDLMFADARGHAVELGPLDILSGLSAGEVLLCERDLQGAIVDRWLVHRQYNDEFGHLDHGERIIVRRAACSHGGTSG
jgi:hypothetical protein